MQTHIHINKHSEHTTVDSKINDWTWFFCDLLCFALLCFNLFHFISVILLFFALVIFRAVGHRHHTHTRKMCVCVSTASAHSERVAEYFISFYILLNHVSSAMFIKETRPKKWRERKELQFTAENVNRIRPSRLLVSFLFLFVSIRCKYMLLIIAFSN